MAFNNIEKMFSEFGLVTDSERADKAEQENKRLAEELASKEKQLQEERDKSEAEKKQLQEEKDKSEAEKKQLQDLLKHLNY